VPDSFPTAEDIDADSWVARRSSEITAAWEDDWDESLAAGIPLALRHVLGSVDPSDTLTLAFWPDRTVAHVLVHVQIDQTQGAERIPMEVHRKDGAVVDRWRAEHLGEGLVVQHFQNDPEAALSLGGTYLLFEGSSGSVLVFSELTLLPVLSQLIVPLATMVDSLRIGDEDEPWLPTTVVEDDFTNTRDEEWPVLAAGPQQN
jgi:hypothetical protein